MWEHLSLLGIGLSQSLQPLNFLMILTGLTIGTLAGALPGITMLNAIVLVLPFTYLMSIVPSILLLVGVYCGGVYAGSITGILFNIPGDPMNVPTTWEGYRLNKKGFAAKALGMAVICSAIGGFLSAMVMTLASPPLAKVALSFSSCEYFAVVFLGLTSVVVLGTHSVGSAVISLFCGMFLGTIGMEPIYGVVRFTFGVRLFETGINFIVVLIGLFAIGEILEQLSIKGKKEPDVSQKARTQLPGFRDLWKVRNTILRSFGIGTTIGIIPGAGATVASFVCYGVEKQVSREPEKFGTGVWEGLAASETGNNASTGGAMIPLLTLGIPGSGATAVILGAFLLHGVQPGPMLFTKSPDQVYTIFVGILLANLLMILVGMGVARFFAELMKLPETILDSFIMVFCFLGAFALRNDMADVWLMTFFGIVGFFMRRYGLPIPPMILGIILGPLAESYFMTSMIGAENNFFIFFQRPISACLIIISIGLLLMPTLRRAGKKGRKLSEIK